MAIKFENVGIAVRDLEAAIAFLPTSGSLWLAVTLSAASGQKLP